ncbi:MAG: response regulator [Bacteroidota bacterium]
MKNKLILIVDDIYANRLLLSELIKCIGFSFLLAENGRQALDYLEKEEVDLILMDVEMPVMNGLETTIHIREKLPHPLNKIPIIALTAHNPQLFFDDYKGVGFTNLLVKPYSMEKLIGLIHEYTAD